ncbi:iron chelate uptake ABC transporter, FeCT family, permease protein [Desulfitobacterium hafniense DP7]|uniref:Iron chelate uptake ABC transporter, FeCT family, permease protein n=1 Tax=Desulfitobacterium hafniense DP7 TaxID=537010 RepID=G9XRJ9_DESHA|nr:iron ABC transporter permease [Desulfitobacterium hafniense]EHL05681.1 iron chelate uptake ABC transporter, FeCT family, permease protein [Desulfitobacterium hafniense DP7]
MLIIELKRTNNQPWQLGAILGTGVLTVALSLTALCLGRYELSIIDVVKILLSAFWDLQQTWTDAMADVVFQVRLPRVFAALLVGAGLAISGTTYQGIFKNPLVSPDLLGVSSGACVGAALAILNGLDAGGIQICALLGGLLAVAITTTIPKLLRNSSNLILVLAGIIVAGFMSSALGLLKYVADPETQLPEIVFWQMGSLATTSMGDVMMIVPAMLISMALLIAVRWRINILSLGDEEAGSLGINIRVIRGLAIVCSTVTTACAVCISGTVGWIGLVVPHLCRMLIGPDNTRVIPLSIFVGASFMLVVDTVARTVTSGEIPLSILTGFIGAPLYGWLLFKQRMKIK